MRQRKTLEEFKGLSFGEYTQLWERAEAAEAERDKQTRAADRWHRQAMRDLTEIQKLTAERDALRARVEELETDILEQYTKVFPTWVWDGPQSALLRLGEEIARIREHAARLGERVMNLGNKANRATEWYRKMQQAEARVERLEELVKRAKGLTGCIDMDGDRLSEKLYDDCEKALKEVKP